MRVRRILLDLTFATSEPTCCRAPIIITPGESIAYVGVLALAIAIEPLANFCSVPIADIAIKSYWLNNQHRAIKHGVLFAGKIDGAALYPRGVIKQGAARNAAA